MKTLLQIKSSIFSDRGQSSRLANDFVARWRQAHPAANVVVRDLSQSPVPHLTAERFQVIPRLIDQNPSAHWRSPMET